MSYENDLGVANVTTGDPFLQGKGANGGVGYMSLRADRIVTSALDEHCTRYPHGPVALHQVITPVVGETVSGRGGRAQQLPPPPGPLAVAIDHILVSDRRVTVIHNVPYWSDSFMDWGTFTGQPGGNTILTGDGRAAAAYGSMVRNEARYVRWGITVSADVCCLTVTTSDCPTDAGIADLRWCTVNDGGNPRATPRLDIVASAQVIGCFAADPEIVQALLSMQQIASELPLPPAPNFAEWVEMLRAEDPDDGF